MIPKLMLGLGLLRLGLVLLGLRLLGLEEELGLGLGLLPNHGMQRCLAPTHL